MSLTNRILIAMVAGIVVGSIINMLMLSGGVSDSLKSIVDVYLVNGLFDVVGRIFVASLKLLVVPLVRALLRWMA